MGGEVCTDVDGNGLIGGGDCCGGDPCPDPDPPDDGDGTCNGEEDFCCAARSKGELGASIAGRCETWRFSEHTYSAMSGLDRDDYYFRWFSEWDLGHRMSDPVLLAEGTGLDTVNTEDFYVPGTRFRISVQVRKLGTDKTGLAYMDVESIDNPYTANMVSAICGWKAGTNMFPFPEDVGDVDQDPAREHMCYVRGCSGQRKFLRGMGGDTSTV